MKAEAIIRNVSGKISAPSSKSAVQRYLAGTLLADGISEISAGSMCDDSLAALSIIKALGAEVEEKGEKIFVKGGFNPVADEVNCGESGLSSRMFIPVAALSEREITLTGRGSLLKRPFGMIVNPLNQLGVSVKTSGGLLPVKVKGPLRGGDVNADGSISSQFITGLLMALPVAEGTSRIFTGNLVSRPYIDLTLKTLAEFGVKVINDNYRVFHVEGNQKYRPGKFKAEGDWSGAAFILVMGALGGSAEVEGLDPYSVQADRAVIDALILAGADVKTDGTTITVTVKNLKNFTFDITDCPDIAPPLAVLATACTGCSVLKGADRLVAKESNRAETICRALNSIGANVSYNGKELIICGVKSLKGGESSAYNDHRIAMALASASVISGSPVIIDGYECVNKSYPGFAVDFEKLGGRINFNI